jgi:ADP-ribose pyrophosphatase YjhB (NUDIX family)
MIIEQDLYEKILRVMPIPCVDLLVGDSSGRILLVKRNNEPMAGQWWFPGGRVLFNETRDQAARRKLLEECGLTAVSLRELGTFDLILPVDGGQLSHGITTLFAVSVADGSQVTMDEQSSFADWRTPRAWLNESLHEFVKSSLRSEGKMA